MVLTALQIVLGRWAGDEDVLIGLKVPKPSTAAPQQPCIATHAEHCDAHAPPSSMDRRASVQAPHMVEPECRGARRWQLDGRIRPELAETIGCIRNEAMVRTLVDPKRSFGELVRATAAQLADALNQEAPFE